MFPPESKKVTKIPRFQIKRVIFWCNMGKSTSIPLLREESLLQMKESSLETRHRAKRNVCWRCQP